LKVKSPKRIQIQLQASSFKLQAARNTAESLKPKANTNTATSFKLQAARNTAESLKLKAESKYKYSYKATSYKLHANSRKPKLQFKSDLWLYFFRP
jgi:hypothetical protein